MLLCACRVQPSSLNNEITVPDSDEEEEEGGRTGLANGHAKRLEDADKEDGDEDKDDFAQPPPPKKQRAKRAQPSQVPGSQAAAGSQRGRLKASSQLPLRAFLHVRRPIFALRSVRSAMSGVA